MTPTPCPPPFFDPQSIKISHSGDTLWLITGGHKVALGPPRRALPLSRPAHFIVLSDSSGNELGMVTDIALLDDDSRGHLEDALRNNYRITTIVRVLEVERNALSGQIRWKVEIAPARPGDARGEIREFFINGPEDVQSARYPQIYLHDTAANRYEIENWEALDPDSRRTAERYL